MAGGDGRRPLVGGNWKMHTTRAEARTLLAALARDCPAGPGAGVDVVVFPPAPWLGDAADLLGGTAIAVGVQDVHPEASGAFTGAVSAPMVAGVATWALTGHSERRRFFGDTDAVVARKLAAAVAAGLHPLLAVGESAAERAAGQAAAVLQRQLAAALAPLLPPGGPRVVDDLAVAYEPVWAIGSGRTATPEEAQEGCRAVRAQVAAHLGAAAAARCRVLYGGSVTPDTAPALLAGADVDGVLVGGASLDAAAFAAICRAAAAAAA